ncbi:MAG: hypothetical protein KBS34_04015 [Phascolarctobacterium sp.]|nr:hypothetical protein [Candidatus Phascolarctobacterium equi]
MKMTHNGNTMTTGAKYDRINLKHAVRDLKSRKLKGATMTAHYAMAPAAHSGQVYIISHNNSENAAIVQRIAIAKAMTGELIWSGELYGRTVAVIV